MSEAMLDALRAIQSDIRQVEVLSQNIANANTPGFRSMAVSGQPFSVDGPAEPGVAPSAVLSTVGGALTATGRNLDVALAGAGFLEVESPHEATALLIRGGSLKLASDGTLIASGNHPVLDGGGRISLSGDAVSVNSQGEVLQNGEHVATLSVVNVDEKSGRLQIVAPGVYEVDAAAVVREPGATTVLQGYLEQSNVNSSKVLIQMMELSKHVESVQRSLSALDQMLDTGINDIGN